MRNSRIYMITILLASTLLLFTACSKDGADSPGGGGGGEDTSGAMLDIFSAGGNAINALMLYGKTHQVDPVTALYAIVDSVKKFSNVQAAKVEDSSSLVITMKSGLKTLLTLNFLNDDGSSIYRGGGGGNYKLEGLTEDENKRILAKNKRILFYCPPFDEFYTGTEANQDKVLEKIAIDSKKDIIFERVTGYATKPSIVKTFKDYGMVIMSTHGVRFGFIAGALNLPQVLKPVMYPNGMYLLQRGEVKDEQELKTLITMNNEAGIYESLIAQEFVTSFSIKVKKNLQSWVDDVNTYIGNDPQFRALLIATTKYMEKLPPLDSTIIFGNMCYSGATNDNKPFLSDGPSGGYLAIRDAMMKLNPGAYYCYSSKESPAGLTVVNGDAITSEQSVLRSLLQDMDTTGNAHKTNTGEPIMARSDSHSDDKNLLELTLFGKDNIWYGCGSGQITDERDGNVYKTVCVNGKEWMAENLRFNAPGSVLYNNDAANAATMGRLYSWGIVMNGQAASDAIPSGVRGICPKGWHIPSAGEFDKMIADLGGLNVAGGKMKATTGWDSPAFGSNESGLNILPAGMYNPGRDFGFSGLGNTSNIRSSSSTGNGGSIPGALGVWTYTLFDKNVTVKKINYSTLSSAGDPWYYSCRCAKD